MNIKILNVLDFTGCVCTRVCSVYACACVLACEGVVRGWKWGLGSSFGFPLVRSREPPPPHFPSSGLKWPVGATRPSPSLSFDGDSLFL